MKIISYAVYKKMKQPNRILIYNMIFLIAFLLYGCKNDLDEAKKITLRENTSIEKITGVEIVYSERGSSRIVARAPEAFRYATDKPYMEFPKGITMKFLNEKEVESTLQAKYALVQEGNKLMIARNNVVVVNKKGERLDTEELIWDEEKEIIYSNSFVKITTDKEIIMGTGMTANQNFTNYVIKNISGTIKITQP
ncbi:MAG: LPS export ABC transporter periplasmic protein LptC [Chitinophagales bacterium]|nr:LPS export ABC transporter periplasmic protein LptC [Chitinophagales bacterium]MDW8274551.1 LPS export ABC transporter periplasmic protein LptC [Chitinophagales bacterium]